MTKSIILQRISATIQFILGFLIGISLIVGVSGGLVFAYYKKMSVLPSKPNFPAAPASSESASPKKDSSTIEPLESNTTLEAEPEAEPEEVELPPNAYYAKVTWPQGLSLRSDPDLNAGRIGGIGFEETIMILEDSADGKWQRVKLPWSGQEGWVKAGNVERTSY